jgi:hypothetical protein
MMIYLLNWLDTVQASRSPAGARLRHWCLVPAPARLHVRGAFTDPLGPSWPDQITRGRRALASTWRLKTVDCCHQETMAAADVAGTIALPSSTPFSPFQR